MATQVENTKVEVINTKPCKVCNCCIECHKDGRECEPETLCSSCGAEIQKDRSFENWEKIRQEDHKYDCTLFETCPDCLNNISKQTGFGHDLDCSSRWVADDYY